MDYTKNLKEIKMLKAGILCETEAKLYKYILYRQKQDGLHVELSNSVAEDAFCIGVNNARDAGRIHIPNRILTAYDIPNTGVIHIERTSNNSFIIEGKLRTKPAGTLRGISMSDNESIPKNSKYITTVISKGGQITKRMPKWVWDEYTVVQTYHMNEKHPYIELCLLENFEQEYGDIELLISDYGREFQYFPGKKLSHTVIPNNRKTRATRYCIRGFFRKQFNIDTEYPYDIYECGNKYYIVPHWKDDTITKEEYDRKKEKTDEAFLCEQCHNEEPTLKEIMTVLTSFKDYVKNINAKNKIMEKEMNLMVQYIRKQNSKIFELEQQLKIQGV